MSIAIVIMPFPFEITPDSVVFSLSNAYYFGSVMEKYSAIEAFAVLTSPINNTELFYSAGCFEYLGMKVIILGFYNGTFSKVFQVLPFTF